MKAKPEVSSAAIGLMKAADAARALAISQRKLWELTNCGSIPCVRIGRAVRYDIADLQAWIKVHKGGRR